MAYKSTVDIGLGRSPITQDDEMLTLLQPVHNAIHILNQFTNEVVDVISPPTRESPPEESFSPRLNTFYAPAASNATQGRIVSMQGSQFKRGVGSYEAGGKRFTEAFGISLEDPEDNPDTLIGWPPFVLYIDLSGAGAGIGDRIHCDKATGAIVFTDGQEDEKYLPVGQVINTNAVLFIPNMHT